MPQRPRLLLVDDHVAIAQALQRSLEDEGYEVVAIGADGEQAIALAAELHPDVILMDLNMPVMDGVTATRRIVGMEPSARIVVFTVHDDPASTWAAIEAGAVAYLTKGSSRLEDIVELLDQVRAGVTDLSSDLARAMLAGPTPAALTPRELEVLQSYAAGARSVGDVARALDISPKTAEKHLTKVYGKLDAANQLDAVLAAVERGIIDLTAGRYRPGEREAEAGGHEGDGHPDGGSEGATKP
jgi:DNA-binding NarL/FixJ family response regulator